METRKMNPGTYVSPKNISKALKNGTEDIHESQNDDPGDNLAFFGAIISLF